MRSARLRKKSISAGGAQSKYVLKANWIDITHSRNIIGARLWGDVVKSRDDYESIPELLKTSPNHQIMELLTDFRLNSTVIMYIGDDIL